MKTIRVRKAATLFAATIGLIGAKKPYPLLLSTRFGIHTFFLAFPIDIVILSSDHRIVLLKKSLLPNRFYFWDPRWSIVLEMPSGAIDQLHLSIGDQLSLIPD
jgi:uncharacterized membrane protein (UPF0127 family)